MLGLKLGRTEEWSPPPCICGEIEARVRAACAMRDEMATWPTPLEEWKQLQTMPVLVPKGARTAAPAPVPTIPRPAPVLANPALCPHPMRRHAAVNGALTSGVWICTECGARVGPIDRDALW